MRLLIQFAGQPLVPTVVAYGEVMVGWDLRRLDEILATLDSRAEALARSEAEDEHHLRQAELCAQEAAAVDSELGAPELEGIEPLDDDH